MGVEVEIADAITHRSKVISTSGLMAAILIFGSLSSSITSINVGQVRQCPLCQVKVGCGRKCGDSLWNRVAINYCYKLISVPVGGRHLVSVADDVGRRRLLHTQVSHGRKCVGIR